MKIPQEVIDVIFEEMLQYFSNMSCDEFEIENNKENREFVKFIYGDCELSEDEELFVSAYSVLKNWKHERYLLDKF